MSETRVGLVHVSKTLDQNQLKSLMQQRREYFWLQKSTRFCRTSISRQTTQSHMALLVWRTYIQRCECSINRRLWVIAVAPVVAQDSLLYYPSQSVVVGWLACWWSCQPHPTLPLAKVLSPLLQQWNGGFCSGTRWPSPNGSEIRIVALLETHSAMAFPFGLGQGVPGHKAHRSKITKT